MLVIVEEEMEFISATNLSPARFCFPVAVRFTTQLGVPTRPFRLFPISSKKSDFQDFQGYVKPSRLLPASEVKVCTESWLDNLGTSLSAGKFEASYKVTIRTSSLYGSGLTDMRAGILICLVAENGDSILQRIPASLEAEYSLLSEEVITDTSHFQRGSVDEFIFEGPKLEKIEALWVSLESGQWRLGGVRLVCQSRTPLGEDDDIQYGTFQYDFMVDDVLLGEGSDNSMIELRPSVVTELSRHSFSLSKSIPQSTSVGNSNLSNEDSMREYADLKLSLLLYDVFLIVAGSTVASFSAGENEAFAFLTGGIGGFLYLLLLQRSVDGLPSPSLDKSESFSNFLQSFKGQVTSLVLVLALSLAAVKLISGDDGLVLTPKDLMLGMTGFLACKVAVILAAFKPLQLGLKDGL